MSRKKRKQVRRKDAARKAPVRRPARPGLVAAALFVLCLGCYLANGRVLSFENAGDTIPNRLLPFSLLASHTLTLDPFADDFAARGGYRWYVQKRQDEHLISFYPIGPALLALPVYLPGWAVLAASGRGGHTSLFLASPYFEKVASAVLAALSVALFYLTVRHRLSAAAAYWSALAFGLATSVWATGSQMLWQHGAVVLCLTAGLYFLTRPERTAASTALSGLAFGFAIASRPTAGLFGAAAFAAILLERDMPPRPRLLHAAWFAAGGAPPVLLSMAYNIFWYQSPLGGYSLIVSGLGRHQISAAAPGLLFSPNRGLLVFTPLALLGIAGLVLACRRPREEPLLPLLGLAAAGNFLLSASYPDWSGGWSFGQRYLVDILPVLALAGALALPRLPRQARPALVAALVWSIFVQWNGTFCYPASRWDARMTGHLEESAWDWRHFELWEDFQAWRRGPFRVTPW